MTALHYAHIAPTKPSRAGRMSPLAWMTCALQTRRERRALAKLDARGLADIGLDRSQAAREAARPVWDVPCHWVK